MDMFSMASEPTTKQRCQDAKALDQEGTRRRMHRSRLRRWLCPKHLGWYRFLAGVFFPQGS